MRAYVQAMLAERLDEAARLYYEMAPIRTLHRRWVLDPWERTGLCPIDTVKHWSSRMGMTGGRVPRPLPALSERERRALDADLASVGLVKA